MRDDASRIDWYQITSAPRDGTMIIVKRRQTGIGAPMKHVIARAKWVKVKTAGYCWTIPGLGTYMTDSNILGWLDLTDENWDAARSDQP